MPKTADITLSDRWKRWRLAVGSLLTYAAFEPAFWLLGRRRGARRTTLPALAERGSDARVLVVRLDRIGDFVLTTGFLRELRRNLPEARVTLVVRPELEADDTGQAIESVGVDQVLRGVDTLLPSSRTA